jgi:hypothetical protein
MTSLLILTPFVFLKLSYRRRLSTVVLTRLLKYSLSGPTGHRPWRLGKTWNVCSNATCLRQLGDKLRFKEGGMLTPPLLGLVGVTDLLGPTVESWARSGSSGSSCAGLSPCNLLAVSYACACCLWLYEPGRREWRDQLV